MTDNHLAAPFRLQISAAAFVRHGAPHAYLVARLLRRAADKLEDTAQFAQNLHDADGLKVGKCGLDVDKTPRRGRDGA